MHPSHFENDDIKFFSFFVFKKPIKYERHEIEVSSINFFALSNALFYFLKIWDYSIFFLVCILIKFLLLYISHSFRTKLCNFIGCIRSCLFLYSNRLITMLKHISRQFFFLFASVFQHFSAQILGIFFLSLLEKKRISVCFTSFITFSY